MEKSNVFRGLESFMEATEERLSYLNSCLNDAQAELNELPSDADKWNFDRLNRDIESYAVEIEITENAYNFVYNNFQKIVKDYVSKGDN